MEKNISILYGLEGRVALVTGGARGIGQAACLQFARAGAKVAVVDMISCDETVSKIKELGGTACSFNADVSSADQVRGYVDGAVKAFGRIDALFNAAGVVGDVAPFHEYPDDVFDRIIAINVKGTYLGMKYVLPVMLKQKKGSIINTASVAAIISFPQYAAYGTSKGAVLVMTRIAAGDYAKEGIRVNSVCPGVIGTEMMRTCERMTVPDNPKLAEEALKKVTGMGRYGLPEEIANAVVFLASDAASYMNGANLIIDGSSTAFYH